MYPAAPPSPAPWNVVRNRLPRAPIAVGLVLTLLATGVGLLPWPPPRWAPSTTWLVRDVPVALWALVLTTAVVSLAAATVLLARTTPLGPSRPALWAWLVLSAAALAALVWNALYAAALSTIDYGAIIPVFHWLFTFGPAVLAGLVFRPRGKATAGQPRCAPAS